MKKVTRFWLEKTVCFSAIVLLLGIFKVSAISGFQGFHFSLAEMFTPLIGLYGGLWCALSVTAIRTFFKAMYLSPWHTVSILSLRIPSLCAAAYWAKNSFLTRCLVPMVCIVLFNMHPVGQQAWLYSCYWLIPLALYCASQKNIFVQSISSSFIAHGVGSVLWLYYTPMTAQMFLTLIPVVFVERLLLAGGTAVIALFIEYAKTNFKKMHIRTTSSIV